MLPDNVLANTGKRVYINACNDVKNRVLFMNSMVVIDGKKCLRCGLCVSDCMVKALVVNVDSGLPELAQDGEKLCFRCQHCVALCPTGAVSVNGVSAAQCLPAGELPSPELMQNLIRQRRSIRQFKADEVDQSVLDKLKNALHWTPTGCNDHRLQFFIAGKEEVARFRDITGKYLRFMIKSGLMGLLVPRYRRYFDAVLSGEDVIFRGAPHLIVVMAPAKAPCSRTDQVIALTQFDMLAQCYDLGTCWCGFAEYAFRLIPELRKMISCPRGYRIGGAMLFGKPDVHYLRSTMPEKFEIKDQIHY